LSYTRTEQSVAKVLIENESMNRWKERNKICREAMGLFNQAVYPDSDME
jgi:hypothetical protein